MSSTQVISKVYRPSMNVGQLYARPYGSATAPMPVGNVLELSLDTTEDVETQPNMTVLGGGAYAEVRRVKDVRVKIKLADLNVVNLARSTLGTVAGVEAGTVTDEPHTAMLGGLIRLAHIAPTALTLKKAAPVGPTPTPTPTPVATITVPAAGNYEVRPEGIYVLPSAPDLSDADLLWVSYSYGDYAVVEALTTKAPELELTFGGLNEADSGSAMLVEIWRASQGITKSLALLASKGFGSLDVEGTVQMDPTKTGAGISKYYRTSMV